MEQSLKDLKKGVAHFKNGNFDQALASFASIEGAGSLKPAEQLVLHEYWAASLERLGNLEEALLHARRMIVCSEASHKGYLRMGKILRLLGDNEAAMKAYEMGLRRAKRGLDTIASQLRALKMTQDRQEGAKAQKRGDTYDPFEVLSPLIGDRIVEALYRLDAQNTIKVRSMSRSACLAIQRHLAPKRPLDLIEGNYHKTLKKALDLSPSPYSRLYADLRSLSWLSTEGKKSADENFFGRFDVILLGGSSSMSSDLVYGSFSVFKSVRKLAVFRESMRGAQLDSLIEACPNLEELQLISVRLLSLWRPKQILNGLKRLYISDVKLQISDEDPCIEVLEEEMQSLEAVHISKCQITQRHSHILAFRPALCDLSSDISVLEDAAPGSEFPAQLRALRIIEGHLKSIPMCTLDNLGHFVNLQRLHLQGLTFDFSARTTRPPRLQFPFLKHINIDSVHPIIQLSKWHLPRLSTLSISCCDISSEACLPTFSEEKSHRLEELLVHRNNRYFNAQIYLTLLDRFKAGNIHVLGVGEAHQFFKSNGLQRIQAASEARSCDHILVNDSEIRCRIYRLWPVSEQ